MKEIIISNESEMTDFAVQISAKLNVGDVLALKGGLGAGKTFIAREIIRKLTGKNLDVASPTFNLVQIYDSPLGEIWHFDLYRLKKPEDIYELGLEDALSYAITIIEWPEIIENLLPKNTRFLEISYGNKETERVIKTSD